jgi:hypothetical protein
MKKLLLIIPLLIMACGTDGLQIKMKQPNMTNLELVEKYCPDTDPAESFLYTTAENNGINLVQTNDLLLDAAAIAVLFEKDTGVDCHDVHKVLDHVEAGLNYTEVNYEMLFTTLIEDTAKARLVGGIVQRHFVVFSDVQLIKPCDKTILQVAVDYYREVFQCE